MYYSSVDEHEDAQLQQITGEICTDPVYGNEDDAQSFIQPYMSAEATRLASGSTPLAEKAAAIGNKGYFSQTLPEDADLDGCEEDELENTATQDIPSPKKVQPLSPGKLPKTGSDPTQKVHSPPSPRGLLFRELGRVKAPDEKHISSRSSGAFQGVFSGARQRSLSASTDAFKRIQKALPSISVPTNFLSSFSTPSFFTSTPNQEKSQTNAPNSILHQEKTGGKFYRSTQPSQLFMLHDTIPEEGQTGKPENVQHRRLSVASSKRIVLRRSTSDDSLLYHSMSRVSSVGSDRYIDVNDQINSRFKAIVDSLPDRPTFKLPQIPNIVSSPLKRFQHPISPLSLTASAVNSGSALDRVLESLTGDIVILGGYRGSVLRSAQPPNRQLWVPMKVGLKMRQVELALPLDDTTDAKAKDTVMPSGMLQNIGPVDISRRLFRRLRESENCKKGKLRVWDYGYDWRLSPHFLSKQLQEFLANLPSNKVEKGQRQKGVLVIAHSLGGLITRHAINAQPELFSGVLYAGTPSRCINILGPLRNGDAVLLNEKVLTAAVNFSLRTSFIFLPEDGKCFIDEKTGEELEIDFYDVETWVKNKLSPEVSGPPLPPPLRQESSNALVGLINLSGLPLRGLKDGSGRGKNSGSNNTPGGAVNITSIAAQKVEAAAGAPKLKDGPIFGSGGESGSGRGQKDSSQRQEALDYLGRTLSATRQFRLETQHQPSLSAANRYPPIAVLYGRGVPTVYRARVAGREAIPTTAAYDDLIFRDGDGVVLSRESIPPTGYVLVKGGKVSSTKGHLSLLVDLEGVGKALEALLLGRRRGIGLGAEAR